MRLWLSIIPVEGESRPATARTAGSSLSTARASRYSRSGTPFSAAFFRSALSRGISLSSEAVRQILAAEKGERLERFLQVVQASDLTGLANVLDDELLAFLRELLE